MDLDVFFAGTGGSVPTARRGMPALLVRRGGDKLLFDDLSFSLPRGGIVRTTSRDGASMRNV